MVVNINPLMRISVMVNYYSQMDILNLSWWSILQSDGYLNSDMWPVSWWIQGFWLTEFRNNSWVSSRTLPHIHC